FPLASKSGKLNSEHFKTWLKDVLYPNIGQQSVLLLDSWSGHCSDTIEKTKPADKNIVAIMIPKGTTGRIQPLDVYGFRVWKNFVRRFSDIVLLHNHDVNLHSRNYIIKLQSLVHNQLSSPRYKSLFQYAWYKSGYIDERLENFPNLVNFAFESCSVMKCNVCGAAAIIRCSWCKKAFCIKHFFTNTTTVINMISNIK
ncbi:uncharacterized protein LOC111674213, partial [Orussus abietinus]|uniref:uncharacterized protein LOC111674213 n=1 Tax=Orussus abietinus TaxID=222816 RepID=UPI000C715C4D